MEVEDAIDAFVVTLEFERGRSLNTVRAYERDLRQFEAFLRGQQVLQTGAITGEHAAGWIRALSRAGQSPTSVARKLSSLRGFALFLRKEGHRPDNFTSLLKGPRLTRRPPETLSADEVARLLDAPKRDAQGLRDRAMLELFYSSGLRVSELCHLHLHDLDFEEGFVRVRAGKRNKDRVVPVGKMAREALRNYLTVRPSFVHPRTDSTLFLSSRGGPLSRKTVWEWIHRYAQQAGLEQKVKPHLLRHSFASHLLSNGADLRSIQEMLGHADISTTEIYTQVEQERLLNAHRRFHPRGRT